MRKTKTLEETRQREKILKSKDSLRESKFMKYFRKKFKKKKRKSYVAEIVKEEEVKKKRRKRRKLLARNLAN